MQEPRSVNWVARDEPLVPLAVAATGGVARQLAAQLLTRDSGRIQSLRGAVAGDVIILGGLPEDLPWVPGVQYLGIDPDAPHLLLPTNLAPDIPAGLLSESLYSKYLRSPIAILPAEKRLIPFDVTGTLDRDILAAWHGKG